MITPTCNFIPIETKITKEQWEQLPEMIAWRKKKANKAGARDIETALWLTDQALYLKDMLEYHRLRFEGNNDEERSG